MLQRYIIQRFLMTLQDSEWVRDMPYVETNYGKLINVKTVKAQYIRFYSNGSTSNDANHYIEAEVYGSVSE